MRRAGSVQATGRNLDVAIQGSGYLAVQSNLGSEAYTRAGSLEISAEGLLITRSGLAVAGEGGPLNVPAGAQVSIGSDGTVTAKQGAGPALQVGRIKLVNPEVGELRKGADGLLRMASGEDAPSDDTVRVAEGAVESSNVNVVEAMVSMIAVARQFETQMKLLQTAEQNDQRAIQLLSHSS